MKYKIMVPEIWLVEWVVEAETPTEAKERITAGEGRATGEKAYSRWLTEEEWDEEMEDATPYASMDGWEVKRIE